MRCSANLGASFRRAPRRRGRPPRRPSAARTPDLSPPGQHLIANATRPLLALAGRAANLHALFARSLGCRWKALQRGAAPFGSGHPPSPPPLGSGPSLPCSCGPPGRLFNAHVAGWRSPPPLPPTSPILQPRRPSTFWGEAPLRGWAHSPPLPCRARHRAASCPNAQRTHRTPFARALGCRCAALVAEVRPPLVADTALFPLTLARGIMFKDMHVHGRVALLLPLLPPPPRLASALYPSGRPFSASPIRAGCR